MKWNQYDEIVAELSEFTKLQSMKTMYQYKKNMMMQIEIQWLGTLMRRVCVICTHTYASNNSCARLVTSTELMVNTSVSLMLHFDLGDWARVYCIYLAYRPTLKDLSQN